MLLVLFNISPCLASDANMGTWKLNEAKSKLVPGAPKNTTVVYAAAGDAIKITVEGVTGDGKPLHNEWTGKFDGKDYPVTGDPRSDARAYRNIDKRTVEIDVKKAGKTLATGRIVVSEDGKNRTITISGTDPSGNKFTSSGWYEKQ
jgi:hypothetical protein